MKAILKGVLVVLVTIGLFALMIGKAKAGTNDELKQLLTGKQTVFQGTCSLNNDGLFPMDEKDKSPTTVNPCVVGVDMNEPGEIYYALIQDNRGRPVRLIKVDKDTKKQEILWTNARST